MRFDLAVFEIADAVATLRNVPEAFDLVFEDRDNVVIVHLPAKFVDKLAKGRVEASSGDLHAGPEVVGQVFVASVRVRYPEPAA